MKKLLAILLTCMMATGMMVIPASADGIYYPCYEGEWHLSENIGTPVKLKISNATSSNMNIHFQYGQFAINIYNAKVSGSKVNGNYREEWEGGDFIVSGTISLTLYDTGIWLDWHPYENGRDGGTKGYMFYKYDFSYTPIKDTNVKVMLDGKQLSFDQNPVMMNDRVLVPMRAIFEALGAKVEWYARRNSALAEKGAKNVVLTVDSTYMSITNVKNGQASLAKEVTLDTPSILYNDRTLVPVRAVSEAFDANVTWDGNTQIVNISTK